MCMRSVAKCMFGASATAIHACSPTMTQASFSAPKEAILRETPAGAVPGVLQEWQQMMAAGWSIMLPTLPPSHPTVPLFLTAPRTAAPALRDPSHASFPPGGGSVFT